MKLRDLPQWLVWRSELRDGELTKVPYSPHEPERARTDDSTTWGTLTNGIASSAGRLPGRSSSITWKDFTTGFDVTRR